MGVSANNIVLTWEAGERRDAADRALLLLQLAQPEQPLSELAMQSVGQRNAHLLKLREQLLGETLRCRVNCPACRVVLEFTLNTDDLWRRQVAAQLSCEILARGVRLHLRPPNSLDLAAVVQAPDKYSARQMLVQRCVARATRRGRVITVDALPAPTVEAIAEALEDLDPLAAPPLRLACQDCGNEWSAVLDIGAFVWQEASAVAHRLLREVHQLASAYGWCESDILAMSDSRRRAYLEMVLA